MSDVWIVLISVSAGWVLSVFTPAATRWLTRKRRRRALALLVCPILDRFVADCQATIDDEGDWTGGTRHFSVQMPTGPEFPTQVDWTAINPKLANRILSLPLSTNRADQELGYLGDYSANMDLIRAVPLGAIVSQYIPKSPVHKQDLAPEVGSDLVPLCSVTNAHIPLLN